MREIIFRGKTKQGEWKYGYLYITHNGEYEVGCYNETTNIERVTHIVIPETVGQYTGLTDKNGKMIFEGDVVEAYDDIYVNGFAEVKGKVFYNDGAFDIDVEDIGYIPVYSYGEENIEVIGNIHDNPDLLKGE